MSILNNLRQFLSGFSLYNTTVNRDHPIPGSEIALLDRGLSFLPALRRDYRSVACQMQEGGQWSLPTSDWWSRGWSDLGKTRQLRCWGLKGPSHATWLEEGIHRRAEDAFRLASSHIQIFEGSLYRRARIELLVLLQRLSRGTVVTSVAVAEDRCWHSMRNHSIRIAASIQAGFLRKWQAPVTRWV